MHPHTFNGEIEPFGLAGRASMIPPLAYKWQVFGINHPYHSWFIHCLVSELHIFFRYCINICGRLYLPPVSSQPSASNFWLYVICQQSCFMGCMKVSGAFLIYLVGSIKKKSNSRVIFNLVQVYRPISSPCLHIMSICSTIIFLTQKDPLNNTNFCIK